MRGWVRDRAIYQLAALAYVTRRTKDAGVIILDNVDHHTPSHQRELAEFASIVADSLNCRVIIPIRPYSLYRAKAAAKLGFHIDHVPAHPLQVAMRRIKRFATRAQAAGSGVGAEEHYALLDFSKRLALGEANDDFSDFVAGTVGDNSRLVIQALHNFFVSPFLEVDPEKFRGRPFEPFSGKIIVIEGGSMQTKTRSAALFESFLCTSGRILNLDQFDNVFDVAESTDPFRRIIKPLILLNLMRKPSRSWSSPELGRHLKYLWGISEVLIVGALRDLALQRRPLIWGSATQEFSIDDLADGEQTIHLNDIGEGYIDHVVHNPYYIRECSFAVAHYEGRATHYKDKTWHIASDFFGEVEAASTSLDANVRRRFGKIGAKVCARERRELASLLARASARMSKLIQKEG